MILKICKFDDDKLTVLTDICVKSDSFKTNFIQTCNKHKNWEFSVAVVLDDSCCMTLVTTHAEYCEEKIGVEYNMKELMYNKYTRYLCFAEIDNKTRQIFYACASKRSKSIDMLHMIAIQLEYELYEIRYSHEADLLSLSDPCIPGVGSTRLVYSPRTN